MNVRLFEIFTSIEGEGLLCGTKTLFVRLAGCPFTCFYCDTVEALPLDSGTEYTIEEACNLINKKLNKSIYKVNFTGGEPLLQHEAVLKMAKYVQSKKIATYLESSCYDSEKFTKLIPFIDYLKIEFKTKDSEFVDSKHFKKFFKNTMDCLKEAVSRGKIPYIKIVISSKTKLADFESLIKKIFKEIKSKDIGGFVLQPSYGIAEPELDYLLKFYDKVFPYYHEVRVIPQMHKMINAP